MRFFALSFDRWIDRCSGRVWQGLSEPFRVCERCFEIVRLEVVVQVALQRLSYGLGSDCVGEGRGACSYRVSQSCFPFCL